MNTDPKTATSSDKRASQAHPEQVLTNTTSRQTDSSAVQPSKKGERKTKSAKIYAYYAPRVAKMMSRLEVGLHRLDMRARASAYPWDYAVCLDKVEHDLKQLVAIIYATGTKELDRALGEGESHD